METDEDTAWKERCDRYFSSISESNENIRGNLKSKDKEACKVGGDEESVPTSKFNSARKWLKVVDIHGWTFAGFTNNSIESVLCIIISCLLCGALGVFIYLNVNIYIQKDSHYQVSSLNSNVEESVTFTICNNNLLRKKALAVKQNRFKGLADLGSASFSSASLVQQPYDTTQNLLENSDLVKLLHQNVPNHAILNYFSEFDEDFIPYSYMSSATDFASLLARSVKDGAETLGGSIRPTKAEFKEYGHSKSGMMVHCWNGNRKCPNSYFTEIQDSELGNCVKISPKGPMSDELTLILNAESNDVIDEITSSPGFAFVLRDSKSSHGESRFQLSPGFDHNINVKKSITTVQTTNCGADDSYDQKRCVYECLDAKISQYCQCRYSYDVSSGSQCRINDKFEYICVRSILTLHSLDKLGCGCQPKCRNTAYHADFSSSPWPSDGRVTYLRHFLIENGLNMSTTDIRKSLLKVKIRKQDMTMEDIEEIPDMTLLVLLARVGGCSALLVGVSILSIMEIVWLVIRACIYGCSRIPNRSGQQEIIRRLSESEITSVTWQAYKHRRREETNLPIKNGFITKNHPPLRRNDSKQSRHSKRSNLSPIAEEKRKPPKESPVTSNNFEDKLYARPWDRTGHNRSYNSIITPGKQVSEVPMFNCLDDITDGPLRSSTPENSEMPDHGSSRVLQFDVNRANIYPPKGRIITPADAIQMYGKAASKYYYSDSMYL